MFCQLSFWSPRPGNKINPDGSVHNEKLHFLVVIVQLRRKFTRQSSFEARQISSAGRCDSSPVGLRVFKWTIFKVFNGGNGIVFKMKSLLKLLLILYSEDTIFSFRFWLWTNNYYCGFVHFKHFNSFFLMEAKLLSSQVKQTRVALSPKTSLVGFVSVPPKARKYPSV